MTRPRTYCPQGYREGTPDEKGYVAFTEQRLADGRTFQVRGVEVRRVLAAIKP